MNNHIVIIEYMPSPYVTSSGKPLSRYACSCGTKGKWYVHEGNAIKNGRLHFEVWGP